jgi:putative ABC transport system permease protein
MGKRRWLSHIVLKSLLNRKGRTLLLLAILVMASSLATALGMVSSSIGARVAEETRKYGANLVILPQSSRIAAGSGGLSFGSVGEPAFLSQQDVLVALARSGQAGSHSLHLKSMQRLRDLEVPCEGVEFRQVRRLFPWWQVTGVLPGADGALAGSDLLRRLRLKVGDTVDLSGANGELLRVTITGSVSTGGDEDGILFLDLARLQRHAGRPGQVSLVRVVADTAGEGLKVKAEALRRALPGAVVQELRQVGRTSEELLAKVQLLMLLVTAVVLVCAAASVAGTMSAAVLERGKEIGLLKAMGGSRRDLLLIFSSEALLLGCAGGVGGFLAGSLIAQFVAITVFSVSAGLQILFLPVALGVSLLLAMAGSIGPLLTVFRLDPVQILRGE